MYRIVVAMSECPISSWMALGDAPRWARCEPKVCRRTCQPIWRIRAPDAIGHRDLPLLAALRRADVFAALVVMPDAAHDRDRAGADPEIEVAPLEREQLAFAQAGLAGDENHREPVRVGVSC